MLTGILGSPIVETAVGLIVVWFLAASLCSAVVELIGSAFGFRSNHLWNSLRRLLEGTDATPERVDVEARKLAQKPVTTPTDGPFTRFVQALPGVDANSIKRVRQIDTRLAAQALVVARGAAGFGNSQLGRLVETLPDEVLADASRLRVWLESWFDDQMASLRASYRRRIRWWAALVAAILVPLAGLDSLGLAQRLYTNPTQRTLIQAQAANLVDKALCSEENSSGSASTSSSSTSSTTSTTTFEQRLECAKETAAELSGLDVSYWQLPRPSGGWAWARTVVGTIFSWAAVLAGAPFWFAWLKRIMSLRRDGTSTSEAA